MKTITLHLDGLEKEEEQQQQKKKHNVSRRRDIIKIRAERNEIDTKNKRKYQ